MRWSKCEKLKQLKSISISYENENKSSKKKNGVRHNHKKLTAFFQLKMVYYLVLYAFHIKITNRIQA